MKKILSICAVALLFSCSSKLKRIQNFDPNQRMPQIKNERLYLKEMATLDVYGYSENYPINLGPIPEKLEDTYTTYFLNGITSKTGQPITFEKQGSCCPYETKNNKMGVGMLTKYKVINDGKEVYLYFNAYDRGPIVCPVNFTIKP